MPRTTHPALRHRHRRADQRAATERVVARRRQALAPEFARSWAGFAGPCQPRIQIEEYLGARADELVPLGRRGRFFVPVWRRLHQLADRRADFGYGHDCGRSSDLCDVCRPPRARRRRTLEAEVWDLIAGGWRQDL